MKKIISILLVLVMALGMLALVGCNKTNNDPAATTATTAAPQSDAKLKLGFGVVTSVSATDATAAAAGKGTMTATVAAVLVDADGKIVKSVIDCADYSVEYDAEGKAKTNEEFKTKLEQGDAYGMKSEYGSKREWYEHVDAFCKLTEGKTIAEVKALVAADYKGTADVQAAGCTIYVSDFAKAIEEAASNAKASDATVANTLKIGVVTTQTATNATAAAAGSNKLETYFCAAATDADGKIVAAISDCLEVDFTFDATGKSTFDATKEVKTKREQGDAYGMKSEYGSKREWYEHADAFDSQCIGKKASDIAGLMGADYKGNSDVQSAGCTIYVSGFVKAASKLA